jgi:lipopolysaccharide transport system ATP-binding protein
MCSDVVIEVKGLFKNYETYLTPRHRLKQFILPPIQELLGLQPKKYCEYFSALTDVNFSVKKGETFGIIGRNGSGKSTLLQILCGTLAHTSGSVKVHGKVAALLELGAGFNPEFSGRENVYMSGRLFGLSTTQIEQRFDLIAAFADIGEFIEKPVKTYSSGMYVRLAFAVIAHVDADILVIDEALSVGDAYFVQKCMRFLRAFMEKGTLLFVSHDIGAVTNLCSRALWLERGCTKEIGVPKDIIKHYLEGLVSQSQDVTAAKNINIEQQNNEGDETNGLAEYIDMRDQFVNQTSLRNDIEIIAFDIGENVDGYGAGGAKILDIYIEDVVSARPLNFVVGGEMVRLKIFAQALTDLDSVILGFDLKNRLGQTVFGDNTFLTYRLEPKNATSGQRIIATFEFRMPVMPVGEYAITIAIATGTQDAHVQQHWVHDALILNCQSSRICLGAIGIPMRHIEIAIN